MIFPVILAGGKGERFWPYSNQEHPKQLLPLVTKQSMLEDTFSHIKKLKTKAPTLIIASQNLVGPISKLLGKRKDVILVGEPMGRNTAAAIGLACKIIEKIDPNGVMAVLTADHAIETSAELMKAVKAAAQRASKVDALVTFGIKTTRPETGYGYVEASDSLGKVLGLSCYKAVKFHEKPNAAKAKVYHRSSKYFWNSGMFVWKVSYLWSLFSKYLPDMYRALEEAKLPAPNHKDFIPRLKKAYASIEGESIDYGIMEKAPRIEVVVPHIKWDDIGAWSALDRRHPQDKQGNIHLGETVLLETGNTTCFSDSGMVATFGVKDLLVVQHNGVTMVVHKDKRADLKKLVKLVGERKKLKKYL